MLESFSHNEDWNPFGPQLPTTPATSVTLVHPAKVASATTKPTTLEPRGSLLNASQPCNAAALQSPPAARARLRCTDILRRQCRSSSSLRSTAHNEQSRVLRPRQWHQHNNAHSRRAERASATRLRQLGRAMAVSRSPRPRRGGSLRMIKRVRASARRSHHMRGGY